MIESFKFHGIAIPLEIQVVKNAIHNSLKHDPRLKSVYVSDITGMVGLSTTISKALKEHESRTEINISGETSELLGRLAESLSGRSMTELIGEIKATSKVRV